jgi:putative DNA primase/helicase
MSSQRPAIAVPDGLAELDRWAVWRMENGAKIPYRIDGRRASSPNAPDWGELELAQHAIASGRYTGLAFAFFEEDGLVGIDIDDVLDASGDVKPWGRGVVARFFDSYMEVSPSGCGLKIWARGTLPANLAKIAIQDGGIEMYSHGRYFTFTGRRFRGAPLQIENHQEDIHALYGRLTADKKTWKLQPLQGGRIPHGQQHSTLVSIAGTLRARRVCDEAILACLLEINARQCERPGNPENILRIVQSSRRWGVA